MQTSHDRLSLCIDGLSVGDAFGEMFFGSPNSARSCIAKNQLPPGNWYYTDDTELALAIVDVLREKGHIDQDMLAERFALRFQAEPDRGYGKGTRIFCEYVNLKVPWRTAHSMAFKQGSMGNGSAMRVAPVGAWFADAVPEVIADEARKSAEITHHHPEGIAGAIAVALATATACQMREQNADKATTGQRIFETLFAHVPQSKVLDGIRTAFALDPNTADSYQAAKILGNGFAVSCPDTVPYVIWSACRNIDDYCEAILNTLSGGGDTDTTCAMVGGIVAMYAGRESIPPQWLSSREKLKFW
ncbi:MAG: ADP-ribosylglycohydrolase family protein [Candidatus Methylacidiphilales bacterium]|nr:ADP-ribosylglycohydrolase family protein [Candidatus Methylacidiphilales bacterium]